MKRFTLILLAFAMSFTTAFANIGDESPEWIEITLSCNFVHGKPLGKPGGRMPIKMSRLSISKSSVEIEERLVGYTMVLLSDGEIVYKQFVTSTHIEFPLNISGDYEIRFTNDVYCYYGFFSI